MLHDICQRAFLVDLSLPLTIGAVDADEAADLAALWFAGLRDNLEPGFLYSHAVKWKRPTFAADISLTLRLSADTPAGAISRVPAFCDALNADSSVFHIGDWRKRVSVRA